MSIYTKLLCISCAYAVMSVIVVACFSYIHVVKTIVYNSKK